MKRDCSTCTYKEGSCYPSTTILDKDKTCRSYEPDYEEYVADLEKENAELKERNRELLESCEGATMMYKDLCKAKTYLKYFIEILKRLKANKESLVIEAEQFLSEVEK